MPVRSLHSPLLRWPDKKTVEAAIREWANAAAAQATDAIRIGYFGSYARGDWGVGSDLDVVIIVESSGEPFERRALRWDVRALPVPADVLVYTAEEWHGQEISSRFARTLRREVVWVYNR